MRAGSWQAALQALVTLRQLDRAAAHLRVPRVGYGCAGRATADLVEAALRAGVRLLDTAQAAEW